MSDLAGPFRHVDEANGGGLIAPVKGSRFLMSGDGIISLWRRQLIFATAACTNGCITSSPRARRIISISSFTSWLEVVAGRGATNAFCEVRNQTGPWAVSVPSGKSGRSPGITAGDRPVPIRIRQCIRSRNCWPSREPTPLDACAVHRGPQSSRDRIRGGDSLRRKLLNCGAGVLKLKR